VGRERPGSTKLRIQREQTCAANCFSRPAASRRRFCAAVTFFGVWVENTASGNLAPHQLQAKPWKASISSNLRWLPPGFESFERRTDAVLFGLAISAANLPSAFFKVFLILAMLNGFIIARQQAVQYETGCVSPWCCMQPLVGGAPVQLTHFDSEPAVVLAYAWSRDGEKFSGFNRRIRWHSNFASHHRFVVAEPIALELFRRIVMFFQSQELRKIWIAGQHLFPPRITMIRKVVRTTVADGKVN
jgi:hypothetical protein